MRQLERYWCGKTAENFMLHCDPERTDENGPPGMNRDGTQWCREYQSLAKFNFQIVGQLILFLV